MKLSKLLCLLVTLPFCAPANAQTAQELIACLGEDDSTVVLDLWKPSQYGVPLHCLNASFATEMVACAPNGGWGLGSDADMSVLVEVSNDWKTAHKHTAGKVMASAGNRGVRFIAHDGLGIASNLSFEWKFIFDRQSGKATWFAKDGARTEYDCER